MEAALASPRWLALAYLLALILAETVITLIEPRAGMVLHGLILLALLMHAALIGRGPLLRLLLALALAPLIRLVSLTMPLPDFPFIYWYIVVGLPLLLAGIIAARLGRLNRGMLGLKWRALPWQFVIALTGIAFGLIEYLILRPQPLVAEFSWRQILLPALILLIFTGFLEEFIFRGVIQYSSLRNLGRLGLFYVAAIFAVLHFGYRSVLDVVFVFGVALFFGYVTLRTGSILGTAVSHGLTNITLFLVFPFLLVTNSPQVAPTTGAEASQQNEIPRQLAPTPEIVGPALWAPAPQKVVTATPDIPQATSTSTSTRTASATPTPTFEPTSTPLPTTAEPVTCRPPKGWVRYSVSAKDTLLSIAQDYGISTTRLRSANCIDSGQGIGSVGGILYVPKIQPTKPPPAKATSRPASTATLKPTNASQPPTATVRVIPATTVPTKPPPAPTSSALPPPSVPTQLPPTATNPQQAPTEAPPAAPPTNMPIPPPSATPTTPEPTIAPETTEEPPVQLDNQVD
jgi:membrane protease YdiL (CAAX protease family)